jgi:hypothetical protein
MPTNFDFKRSSVGGDGGGWEALAIGGGGVIWRGGKPYQRPPNLTLISPSGDSESVSSRPGHLHDGCRPITRTDLPHITTLQFGGGWYGEGDDDGMATHAEDAT